MNFPKFSKKIEIKIPLAKALLTKKTLQKCQFYCVFAIPTFNMQLSSSYFDKSFKDTLKAFDNSKNYELMFFDMQKYICSESLFNTLYIEIK